MAAKSAAIVVCTGLGSFCSVILCAPLHALSREIYAGHYAKESRLHVRLTKKGLPAITIHTQGRRIVDK